MRILPRLALLAAILLAVPPGMAPGGIGGVPSTNPADPPRLLGGEQLLYQFDAGDMNTDHYGSVLDRSGHGRDATVAWDYEGSGAMGFGGSWASWANQPQGLRVDRPQDLPVPAGEFALALWLRTDQFCYNQPCYRWALDVGTPDGNTVLQIWEYYEATYVYVSRPWGGGINYYLGQIGSAWHHFAVVLDDGHVHLYMDGVQTQDIDHGNNALYGAGNATSAFVLGDTRSGNAGIWFGYYDELRLYDRALSAAEVRDIAYAPYRRPNLPPVADAGADQVVPCTGPLTTVDLDATASRDPEGAPLGYAWSSPDAQPVADPASALTGATYALGTHAATVTVDDGELSASDGTTVTVVDFTPPVLTATSPDGPGLYAGDTHLDVQAMDDRIVLGSLDVTAEASDLCSSVAAIEFTVDDGTRVLDTEAPFGFTYAPEGLGVQYQVLSIVAIDAFGNRSPATTFDLTILALDPRLPAEAPGAPPLPALPPLPPLPA